MVSIKFGFMYRGNGYGWWKTEKFAIKKAQEKLTFDWPYCYLWISKDGKNPYKAIRRIEKESKWLA